MVLHGPRTWSMQIIGAGVWCWWFITSNSKSVLFHVACFCFLVHVFGTSCGHVMIECNVSVTWLAPLSFTFASCCMFLDVLGVMWGCMVTSQEWNALFCNIFEPSCFFGLHSKEELLCLATFLWFLGFLGFVFGIFGTADCRQGLNLNAVNIPLFGMARDVSNLGPEF